MASFAYLEKQKVVTAEELKAVLQEYATSGACISSKTVIGIIRRTKLTDEDKAELIASAETGRDSQAERLFHQDAKKYQEVIDFLRNS
jgi:hypothetical protein